MPRKHLYIAEEASDRVEGPYFGESPIYVPLWQVLCPFTQKCVRFRQWFCPAFVHLSERLADGIFVTSKSRLNCALSDLSP